MMIIIDGLLLLSALGFSAEHIPHAQTKSQSNSSKSEKSDDKDYKVIYSPNGYYPEPLK